MKDKSAITTRFTQLFRACFTLALLFDKTHLFAQSERVTFYLNPTTNTADQMKNGVQLKSLLEKETGLTLEMEPTSSNEELVAKFGGDKPCFAFLNSYGYVVANTKYSASAKLRTLRNGKSLYYGMIVVNSSAGIESLKDLNGKTIAYTDNLSTSGYLYPKTLLEKNNIKPGKVLFVNSHEEVIAQVYAGKVPAGAAYYSPESTNGEIRDARAKLAKKHPDVAQKVKILTKTDFIPNEPVAFSKSVNKDVTLKIATALVRIAGTEIGKRLLMEMFNVEGLVRASDGDYNSLRSVIAENQAKF